MHFLKRLWVRGLRRAREEYEEAHTEIEHSSPIFRLVVLVILAYLVIGFFAGIYWSLAPATITPNIAVRQLFSAQPARQQELPKGVATTAGLIAVTQTLWEKPGGYLTNDMFPPGIWLDDMPHWEYGVLLQARDMTQMLRGSLSQSSFDTKMDVDLQKAETRLNFANNSWVFPASESHYKAGVEHLRQYAERLQAGDNSDAHFYADAQHLNDYLAGVEQRLKNLSQRLTASVGPRINTDAAAMPVQQADATGLSNGLYTKTPWLQIDDVFYEARGSAWALIGLLGGVEVDFSDVLQNKNAQASFSQIIRELTPTQQTIYSPVIMNGEGFGFVANHSLVMASYLARAQAAVADCRRQLLAPSP